jgi:hypothetical protein
VKTQAQISSLAFLFFSFAFLSMPACSSLYRPIQLDPDTVQYLLAWNGYIRCELVIRGPDYENKEWHTWSLRRARPGVKTTGSWTLVGFGRWKPGDSENYTYYEWTINPTPSKVIYDAKFLVSIAGGKVSIERDRTQSQPSISNCIQGYSQQTVAGKTKKPVYFDSAFTKYEWNEFPTIEGPATSKRFTGSISKRSTIATWNLHQPAGVDHHRFVDLVVCGGWVDSAPAAVAAGAPNTGFLSLTDALSAEATAVATAVIAAHHDTAVTEEA